MLYPVKGKLWVEVHGMRRHKVGRVQAERLDGRTELVGVLLLLVGCGLPRREEDRLRLAHLAFEVRTRLPGAPRKLSKLVTCGALCGRFPLEAKKRDNPGVRLARDKCIPPGALLTGGLGKAKI